MNPADLHVYHRIAYIIVTCRFLYTGYHGEDSDVTRNSMQSGHTKLCDFRQHAPFHASMLRPASHAGPMHETTGVVKLVNAALLSLLNETCVNVCCATGHSIEQDRCW